MINLIQTNSQLFSLSALLLLIMIALWVLQFLIIRYSTKARAQAMHYWTRFKQSPELNNRFIRLKSDYPKSYHFLSQRFDTQHFYGLPLTGLLVVGGYTSALFIGLVEDVVTSDSIVAMDYFVSQQMSVLSDSLIVSFFIAITSLASTPITCLIVLLTSVLCWIIGKRYIIIGLLIAVIGSTLFTYISKLLFNRVRPQDILLFEQTSSFPSGHATVTVAMYGFIAYMAIRFSRDFSTQVRILMLTLFLSVLIGLSRIVLNEHYLSDVLGGYLVGTLWLTVAISVTEWLRAKGKVDWQIHWSASQISLVRYSIVAVVIATLLYANIYQFPLLL